MLRSRRTWLNSVASIVETLALPLLMALATPYFIQELGIGGYGLWALVNSVVAGMSVLNVGGADAIVKYVSEYRSSKSFEYISSLVDSILKLNFIVIVVAIFFAVCINVFEVDFWSFNLSLEELRVFNTTLSYAVVIFSLKIFENNLLAVYRGFERFYISAPISLISRSGYVAIQILAVSLGKGLEDIFKYAMFFSIFSLFFQVLLLKYSYTWFSFGFSFDLKPAWKILPFLRWTWLGSIVAVLSSQMDRWILASLSSVEILGLYSLVILIFINLHSITSSSMAWLFPVVSRLEKNNNLSSLCVNLVYIITALSFCGVVFLHLVQDVFVIWLGEELFNRSWAYISLALWMLPIYAVSVPSYYMAKGKGLVRQIFFGDLFSAVLRLVLISYFYSDFGLYGVLYAMAISGGFISMYFTYLSFYYKDKKISIAPLVLVLFTIFIYLFVVVY